MTEELEQKTKKWVQENACDWCINADECEQGCIDCHGVGGYIAGATEATKELKEIIRELIENRPDTYSGTNIELQQKKMFAFQNAVNKAEAFLKE